jgi:hypothetical protein
MENTRKGCGSDLSTIPRTSNNRSKSRSVNICFTVRVVTQTVDKNMSPTREPPVPSCPLAMSDPSAHVMPMPHPTPNPHLHQTYLPFIASHYILSSR